MESCCHFWCLAVTFGVLLSLSGVLPFLFSKADLSDVGGEVSAYDADHFAGDQGGQDGALPDADAGIPEGDQVEAEDSEQDADRDGGAVHDRFYGGKGFAGLFGNGQGHALHGHGDQVHLQVEENAEGYEDRAGALHEQAAGVAAGKEQVSDHPFGEIDKVSEDRGEDDLEEVDRIEFPAQQDDLYEDVKAEDGGHTCAGLSLQDVTDDVGEGVDRRDPQIGIGGERYAERHTEQGDAVKEDSDPPLGKCAFSH